uniref:Gastric cancer antigen Zg14 homolog n=1 Tax=Lepeophtheirus salmonis TaxID=72036 RepID=C1BUL9_LEPSM|nr:Gastric cancer antigen Zg14 homolog [Lepeophtheirus salmonis]
MVTLTTSGTNEVHDYKVFSIKFDEACKSSHDLFVKRYRPKSQKSQLPLERTLLVANVPPWADKPSIKRLFVSNGAIDAVHFQKNIESNSEIEGEDQIIEGFKFGFVVFERPSSLSRVIENMDNTKKYILSTSTHPIPVGLEKWKIMYNQSLLLKPEMKELQIKKWVENYDKAQNIAPPEDEEGWVTVTRATSKKPVVSKNASAKIKAREQRKRKRKELENFYKFQVKESKIKKLEELRAKFEVDKKKQITMKGERRFKPT